MLGVGIAAVAASVAGMNSPISPDVDVSDPPSGAYDSLSQATVESFFSLASAGTKVSMNRGDALDEGIGYCTSLDDGAEPLGVVLESLSGPSESDMERGGAVLMASITAICIQHRVAITEALQTAVGGGEEGTTPSDAANPGSDGEVAYLVFLTSFIDIPPGTEGIWIEMGRAFCDALDAGVPVVDIVASIESRPDSAPIEVLALSVAAAAMCPEHMATVLEGTSD
jgi:hypothetical protein